MLIRFEISNFLSFGKSLDFSLETAKISSQNKDLDKRNVYSSKSGFNLLKTNVLYGDNGSGKSNLIRAFLLLKTMVLQSTKSNFNITSDLTFLKGTSFDKEDLVSLSIYFLVENETCFYSISFSKGNVVKEELRLKGKKKWVKLFSRKDKSYNWNEKRFGKQNGLRISLKGQALVLTQAANAKNEKASLIFQFFKKSFFIADLTSPFSDSSFTGRLFMKDKYFNYQQQIINFLKAFGFPIKTIIKKEGKDPDAPIQYYLKVEKKNKQLANKTLIEESEDKKYELIEIESQGIQKLIALAGYMVYVLQRGGVLIIDQMDLFFHPLTFVKLIELFHDPKVNVANAQLIFTAHDITPLSRKIFRRDQINFIEKNSAGKSVIFSLAALKGVRNDASFAKDYLKGKYGAIPKFGSFEKLWENS